MKTLEQINEQFLQVASMINEYAQYMEEQERCLNSSLSAVDLEKLSKLKEYLKQHKNSIEQKQEWIKVEWKKISQSRTFHYELLGKVIATILTEQESTPYFYATRLVKHGFQIDEINRPFYKVVSFVTTNRKDLEAPLLDQLSGTMYPFYINNSPVMKPLPRELATKLQLEDTIRVELENRNAMDLYVVTENDIPSSSKFPKTENQSILSSLPFPYVSMVLEKIIETRYHKNGVELTEEEMQRVISEFCKSYKRITADIK